ncbi:MAG: glycosyltransferase family 4 protein [Gemmatimonadetes bacterium]|nr:glycosyltransferase family 4 protein [Gemmatimonadota bacterium]
MRIIVVQPYGHLAGHFSVYTHRLCAALAGQRHEVCVLSTSGFRGDWTDRAGVVHEAVALAPRVRRVSAGLVGWARTRYEWWSVQRRGFQLAAEDRGAVLHILDFETLTLALLNRRYHRPRQVLTLAGADYTFGHYYKGNLLRGWYGALSGRCVADITRNMLTVIHAERLEAVARERGLLNSDDVTLIPWGMDPKPERVSRRDALRALGLREDRPVALLFGQIRAVKGLDDLIRAVARIERGRLQVVVAGEPDATLGFDPVGLATELNCQNDFTFHLHYIVDAQVEKFFRAANFALLPYKGYFHGESGVLAHTSEYGLPVVASDTGELGKRVRDYGLGLLVEPESVEALAAGLERAIATSSAEQESMRQRVSAYALSHTWDRVAERHVEVYRRATSVRA